MSFPWNQLRYLVAMNQILQHGMASKAGEYWRGATEVTEQDLEQFQIAHEELRQAKADPRRKNHARRARWALSRQLVVFKRIPPQDLGSVVDSELVYIKRPGDFALDAGLDQAKQQKSPFENGSNPGMADEDVTYNDRTTEKKPCDQLRTPPKVPAQTEPSRQAMFHVPNKGCGYDFGDGLIVVTRTHGKVSRSHNYSTKKPTSQISVAQYAGRVREGTDGFDLTSFYVGYKPGDGSEMQWMAASRYLESLSRAQLCSAREEISKNKKAYLRRIEQAQMYDQIIRKG